MAPVIFQVFPKIFVCLWGMDLTLSLVFENPEFDFISCLQTTQGQSFNPSKSSFLSMCTALGMHKPYWMVPPLPPVCGRLHGMVWFEYEDIWISRPVFISTSCLICSKLTSQCQGTSVFPEICQSSSKSLWTFHFPDCPFNFCILLAYYLVKLLSTALARCNVKFPLIVFDKCPWKRLCSTRWALSPVRWRQSLMILVTYQGGEMTGLWEVAFERASAPFCLQGYLPSCWFHSDFWIFQSHCELERYGWK